MADVERTTRKQSMKMASVIAGTALGANSIFWLLSMVYYDDKPALETVNVASVRMAFFLLTVLVAAMSYVASLAPRLLGHGVGFAAGIASLVAGVASLGTAIPGVVGVALFDRRLVASRPEHGFGADFRGQALQRIQRGAAHAE